MLKNIAIIIISIILLLYGAKEWVNDLLPEKSHIQALKQTKTAELDYVNDDVPSYRGKILAVVTSVNTMGDNKKTGFEHTELARAYWVFIANGFHVDIASPKGGKPPVVIDGDDMGAYDYAFLSDQVIQAKVNSSLALHDVDPNEYEAVYFVGGKGAMFDFPNDPDVQRITKAMYQSDKVVSAVCHGPAALVNIQLDNGEYLLANKTVSAFTNEEELFLIPEAKQIFPFLLEDKLIERGAKFNAGKRYLEQVSQEGKLITGQNPWSVWTMAEMVVKELGYEPKPRVKTPEENSVQLLLMYENYGKEAAMKTLAKQPASYQRILILMHSVVSFMEFKLGKGFDLLMLAHELKQLNE